jgi:hypothetical protein
VHRQKGRGWRVLLEEYGLIGDLESAGDDSTAVTDDGLPRDEGQFLPSAA